MSLAFLVQSQRNVGLQFDTLNTDLVRAKLDFAGWGGGRRLLKIARRRAGG